MLVVHVHVMQPWKVYTYCTLNVPSDQIQIWFSPLKLLTGVINLRLEVGVTYSCIGEANR